MPRVPLPDVVVIDNRAKQTMHTVKTTLDCANAWRTGFVICEVNFLR